jgi:hypothetical protein
MAELRLRRARSTGRPARAPSHAVTASPASPPQAGLAVDRPAASASTPSCK